MESEIINPIYVTFRGDSGDIVFMTPFLLIELRIPQSFCLKYMCDRLLRDLA